jgi:hypothetical protein
MPGNSNAINENNRDSVAKPFPLSVVMETRVNVIPALARIGIRKISGFLLSQE